jgi:hypothetical protein
MRMGGFQMVKRILLVSAALALLAGTAAGCSQGAAPVSPSWPIDRNRDFWGQIQSSLGSTMEWSGRMSGHGPGTESTFQVRFRNEARGHWQGHYCLHLMAPYEVVADLWQGEFNLAAGQEVRGSVALRFPDGLPNGSYALVLTVEGSAGPIVDVAYVRVGSVSTAEGAVFPEPFRLPDGAVDEAAQFCFRAD